MNMTLQGIFEPHGWCLLWDWHLIVPMVVSNASIAIAYWTIAALLFKFVTRQPIVWENPLLRRIVWLFAAFILLCGTTHIMDIIVVWWPLYWLDMTIRVATAAVSVATAVLLWPMLQLLFTNRPEGADHGDQD